MNRLQDKIQAAIDRRRTLIEDPRTNTYRLFHGTADGQEGLVIEQFADVLVVQLHEQRLRFPQDVLRSVIKELGEQLDCRAAYKKLFIRDRAGASDATDRLHNDPQPWIGAPVEEELTVKENGVRYLIHPYDGFSTGLFLEHRDNRLRVREHAADRRVLNMFSYTGGFSVAAALGDAVTIDSVDLSRRYLEWSKRNFTANNLEESRYRFFCSDVFEFYKRAHRQDRRYDMIILDPPSFARLRRPKRVFVLEEQLEELVAGAVELLDPHGLILLATNNRSISADRLQKSLSGIRRRTCTFLEQPPLPLDFLGDEDYSKSVIARIDQ